MFLSLLNSVDIFNAVDLFTSLTLIALAYLLCHALIHVFSLRRKKISYSICTLHLCASIAAAEFMSIGESDASAYWLGAKDTSFSNLSFNLGTDSMSSIAWFFSNLLNLSFLSSNILFSLFGLAGFLALQSYLEQANSKKAIWLLFLPNLHFWTAYLGKDTLIFFSICMIIWGVWQRGHLLSMLFLIPGFMVRPHVAIITLISTLFYFLVNKKKNGLKVVITMGIIITLALPAGLNYIRVDSLADITSTVDATAYYYSEGSSIDMTSWPLPLRVFAYLYLPLGIYASSPMQYLASIENFIFLLASLWAGWKFIFIKTGSSRPWSVLFPLMLISFALSFSTNNLGIAMRQKIQIMPFFIIFISALSANVISSRKMQ